MKNSLLSASALLLTATVLGQTSSSTLVLTQVSPQMKTVTAEDDRIRHVGGEWLNHIGPVNQLGPAAPINNGPSGAAAINETVIGTTTYDQQTNTAIQRRLLNHTNGDLFAVWTMSQNNDNVWATRGTGYNHFDGTAWDPNPTAQIEANNRTGWPNVVITGTSKEFLAAHSTQNDEIATADRATPGAGTWNIGATSQLDIQVWNRMALGGPNNNTIHLIGLTLPSTIQGGNPGVPFNGVDGALLYNRSSDGGVTWNQISVQLPGADSASRALVTGGTPTFGGDSYSIDANGNNVVISESSIGTGARLWKSTDNGTTWTKTEIWGTPAFDEVNDLIPATFADAVVYPDGANHVIVDGSGTGHVFFGRMGIANDVLNDGTFSFFPGFNGLMYWNEDFGKAQPVT
ncbi:MAG: hypothetical protein AAGB22_07545, partial [Bacteroidota bacterium]